MPEDSFLSLVVLVSWNVVDIVSFSRVRNGKLCHRNRSQTASGGQTPILQQYSVCGSAGGMVDLIGWFVGAHFTNWPCYVAGGLIDLIGRSLVGGRFNDWPMPRLGDVIGSLVHVTRSGLSQSRVRHILSRTKNKMESYWWEKKAASKNTHRRIYDNT